MPPFLLRNLPTPALKSPTVIQLMQANNRLPSYAYLTSEGVQAYAELTEQGTYSLLPAEIEWRDRYPALHSRGYLLRQRYHPNWSPTWTGTNLDPTYCEDSVVIHVRQVSVSLCTH